MVSRSYTSIRACGVQQYSFFHRVAASHLRSVSSALDLSIIILAPQADYFVTYYNMHSIFHGLINGSKRETPLLRTCCRYHCTAPTRPRVYNAHVANLKCGNNVTFSGIVSPPPRYRPSP